MDIACIGVNAIVGSSIFLFPDDLARHLGPASVLAFGFTGLILVSVALCFAEVSSRFDRTGGPYVYARAAFGDAAGFGIGWMCWISSVLAWAAVANAIAEYLGWFGTASAGPFIVKGMVAPVIKEGAGPEAVAVRPFIVKGIAAAVILGFGALNYRGVKLGAWASNFFTAAKLIPLTLFVLAGLPFVDWSRFKPLAPAGWSGLGPACFLIYFAFQGFEVVPVPAGEVDRPKRNVPLATVLSLVFSACLYMLIQAVAVGAFPGLGGSERPLADAAEAMFGPVGAAVMVLGAVFSTTGFTAGTALVCPRYLTALADDNHLPGGLASLHPRFKTPHLAIILTTSLTFVTAMALDFKKLVDFSNVVLCAQYVATCAALPILRRRAASGEENPAALRLPGGYFLAAAGIAATLWLGSQGGAAQIYWSGAILLLGFVLRALWLALGPARRADTA